MKVLNTAGARSLAMEEKLAKLKSDLPFNYSDKISTKMGADGRESMTAPKVRGKGDNKGKMVQRFNIGQRFNKNLIKQSFPLQVFTQPQNKGYFTKTLYIYRDKKHLPLSKQKIRNLGESYKFKTS